MKVTLIQMDLAWLDAAANRQRAERLMLEAERSDLYVLPEMWNTGVTTEPEGPPPSPPEEGGTAIGLRNSPPSAGAGEALHPDLLWMQQMADKLDAAVAGSIAVRLADGTFRNRLYFVTPAASPSSSKGGEKQSLDGVNGEPSEKAPSPLERGGVRQQRLSFYDKHHLFSYGGETLHYTPGQQRTTVEWRGLRFRLSVCYDLRFPLWLRNTDDYDVLVCVASWPAVRIHAWNVLLQARAIENQCYVLGVNRVGSDPVCHYTGGTQVVDPFGFSTVCPDGQPAVLTQTLDMKRLRAFRNKFPVLKERDTGLPNR